jgi:hypothetical protein
LGLLDVLRGERRPRPADLDALFAIGSAAVTLDAGMALHTTSRAGVCFKALEAAVFADLVREIEELLRATAGDSGTTIAQRTDELGFSWVVAEDADVEDLATTTHVVSRSLEERGLSERLLCAVFGFDGTPGPVQLVYAYKRGRFYPFAPREGRRRDTALELRVQAVLRHELPIEDELERWYPVWDAPL